MTSAKKPVVGLTGGIASGKSSVSRVLADLGVGLVDADRVAREVVEPGTPALLEIEAAFGREVLTSDGRLDREQLASRVFQDPDARTRLQAITHPRIAQRSAEQIAALLATSAPYVVYDAPLLVEVGAHRGLDALIVVAAGEDQQVARAMARDGMALEEAMRRIAAQLPLRDKIAAADYVIQNVTTLDALREATVVVHHQILARFGLATHGA